MFKTVVQVGVALSVAIFSMSALSENTIYKCKNQQGVLIYQKTACKLDAETVTSWEQKEKPKVVAEAGVEKGAEPEVLKLKQNANGHYTTEGSVDGKSVSFVVDTGATTVALPEATAHSALIYCDKQVDMATANGIAEGCRINIKELVFGPFFVKDVSAVVIPNLNTPLLGMNVLQSFKVNQEKGEMHISIMETPKQGKDEKAKESESLQKKK